MKQQSTVQKNKLGIIETIRGLAALAVCLFHFEEDINGNGPFAKYNTTGPCITLFLLLLLVGSVSLLFLLFQDLLFRGH